MIFKQETQILKCTFEKEHFSKVKAAFKDRWPVVYIIEDDEKGQAYIGESTNICTRICDHWNNTERRALKNIYIIFNKVFNKSVILDLEAFLIGYIVADGKYRLQNGNGGRMFITIICVMNIRESSDTFGSFFRMKVLSGMELLFLRIKTYLNILHIRF